MLYSSKILAAFTGLILIFSLANKPVVASDYANLTSAKKLTDGTPYLNSRFQCKVLETALNILTDGNEIKRYFGFESWPKTNTVTEITFTYYPHTQMLWLKSDWDIFYGELVTDGAFIHLTKHNRIQIGGPTGWVEPDALRLRGSGGTLTFSRYHRLDFNGALSLSNSSATERDAYAGYAFMDCRAENYFVEELFNLLKADPKIRRHHD